MPSPATLATRLGVMFGDMRLLEGALTHRSFANERPQQSHQLANNERLEFLGDTVLNYIAADLVFRRFPEASEGELTESRSVLIRTTTLAEFARSIDLGSYVRLSKGEEHSGARNRDALLADVFEALLAAIYLDAGMDAARRFMLPLLEGELERIASSGARGDYKSRLQQQIQGERNITPSYHILAATGPDHRREFVVEVRAGDALLGSGRGPSKQAATQDAARAALAARAASDSER